MSRHDCCLDRLWKFIILALRPRLRLLITNNSMRLLLRPLSAPQLPRQVYGLAMAMAMAVGRTVLPKCYW